MAKVNKIKKKKSFMFTTRHHSFLGILGCVLASISLLVVIIGIVVSYFNRGNISAGLARVSFFSLVANVIGLICTFVSLSEKDIYKKVPFIALFFNIGDIGIWVMIIMYGYY